MLYKIAKITLLAVGLLCPPFSLFADDSGSTNKREIELKRKSTPVQSPTGDDDPDTIEASIIGDDLHIGLEEQTGQCNVTVTNSITGSSFQATVSSANPVVYNIGTSDVPLIINVETSDNVSYEGVMMPE